MFAALVDIANESPPLMNVCWGLVAAYAVATVPRPEANLLPGYIFASGGGTFLLLVQVVQFAVFKGLLPLTPVMLHWPTLRPDTP